MLVRIKSDGAIQFEGIATWPATVSKRRRRGSVPTDDNEEEAMANDDMKIRIPRSVPPPPAKPPPERASSGGRPAPGQRAKPKRREVDQEDSDGNLEGFVVDDDDSGSEGESGSEQYEDESDEEDEDMYEGRPSYTATATSDRQTGTRDGLLELPDTYTRRGGNLSAEENQKRRKENALKRKRQAEKAAEKTKKETIERILNQDGAKKKREEKEAKRAKDSKTKREKITMMACNHFRSVSNREHPKVLVFSKDAPLPPMFASTLGAKA